MPVEKFWELFNEKNGSLFNDIHMYTNAVCCLWGFFKSTNGN